MKSEKTNVSVTLDDKLIKKAKSYAKRRGVSLSRLVENYFWAITSFDKEVKIKKLGTLRKK